jgi:protein-S-isoprenylcysteine O-methyltransferase Ste14
MSPDAMQGTYELKEASLPQRVALAASALLWTALVWWLLLAGGLETIRGQFGMTWHSQVSLRSALIAAALTIYYVRLLFTWFLFLRRAIRWQEASAVSFWLLCIDCGMAVAAGTNPAPFHISGFIGLALFCIGSWLNTYSEYARHVWKEKPEHRGLLYSQGPFRLTRHPNYFGDLVAYAGLCLIAGVWWTAIIPAITLAGFVFVNVPALDAHLHRRYGKAFDEYARKTSRLVPFLY